MNKVLWFRIDGCICRISPPLSLDEIQAAYPGALIEAVPQLQHEADMILNMPLADRKPYIEQTPEDQRHALKDEVTKQWRAKCNP